MKKKSPPVEESWSTLQVASFMKLSYQTARNHMLSGVFGPSTYDPRTRRLTVLATRVRAVKAQRKAERHAKRRDDIAS